MYKYGKFDNISEVTKCLNSYNVDVRNIITLEYLSQARCWVLVFFKNE